MKLVAAYVAGLALAACEPDAKREPQPDAPQRVYVARCDNRPTVFLHAQGISLNDDAGEPTIAYERVAGVLHIIAHFPPTCDVREVAESGGAK